MYGPINTLRKLHKLFIHDFVAMSSIKLLLIVYTSPYPNNRAVLLIFLTACLYMVSVRFVYINVHYLRFSDAIKQWLRVGAQWKSHDLYLHLIVVLPSHFSLWFYGANVNVDVTRVRGHASKFYSMHILLQTNFPGTSSWRHCKTEKNYYCSDPNACHLNATLNWSMSST